MSKQILDVVVHTLFSRLDKKGKRDNKSKKWRWFFEHKVMVALNYGEMELDPERVSNIKLFINITGKKEIVHQNRWLQNVWEK